MSERQVIGCRGMEDSQNPHPPHPAVESNLSIAAGWNDPSAPPDLEKTPSMSVQVLISRPPSQRLSRRDLVHLSNGLVSHASSPSQAHHAVAAISLLRPEPVAACSLRPSQ
uniref:Uncharacterized protein n=1 Tax=uncultured SAR11 cluster alpha proteobacterium H17925_45G17 TaxID=715038 RepID=E7CA38_9PROT|nr:hypothetical protein [uncultured SAR11 cluster alpha proteobacterium H17925_45G17]